MPHLVFLAFVRLPGTVVPQARSKGSTSSSHPGSISAQGCDRCAEERRPTRRQDYLLTVRSRTSLPYHLASPRV
ncbi:hypothetical protein B0H14DRAFT_2806214 [Mycena olivaceomarginata]|nr:hypothetical protein B0H14DRAFT_2806214 [Mycena olivaceomarginata]